MSFLLLHNNNNNNNNNNGDDNADDNNNNNNNNNSSSSSSSSSSSNNALQSGAILPINVNVAKNFEGFIFVFFFSNSFSFFLHNFLRSLFLYPHFIFMFFPFIFLFFFSLSLYFRFSANLGSHTKFLVFFWVRFQDSQLVTNGYNLYLKYWKPILLLFFLIKLSGKIRDLTYY